MFRRSLAVLPDERLADRVQRGDQTAFELLYNRHARGVLSFCHQMLGSREEAEDATQQVFISTYRFLSKSGAPDALRAWLYAIARNRCLSMRRAGREYAAELDQLETGDLDEDVDQRAEVRQLLADIRALPEDQRVALVLAEVGDLPHVEIAEVLCCRTSKVKALVFQARSALIDARYARDAPCSQFREQIANARPGAPPRHLRRHLRSCSGCAEYQVEVRERRRQVASLLPLVPPRGLKEKVLAETAHASVGGSMTGGAVAAGAAGEKGSAALTSVFASGGTAGRLTGALVRKVGLGKSGALTKAGAAESAAVTAASKGGAAKSAAVALVAKTGPGKPTAVAFLTKAGVAKPAAVALVAATAAGGGLAIEANLGRPDPPPQPPPAPGSSPAPDPPRAPDGRRRAREQESPPPATPDAGEARRGERPDRHSPSAEGDDRRDRPGEPAGDGSTPRPKQPDWTVPGVDVPTLPLPNEPTLPRLPIAPDPELLPTEPSPKALP